MTKISIHTFLLFAITICSLNAADDQQARYEVIQKLLDSYQRPFTTLEIDAEQGYNTLKIAAKYNCAVCVMTASNTAADKLLEICKSQPDLHNIILLNKQFTTEELQHFSECEHFDVVLALNNLDQFGEQWHAAIDSLCNMAHQCVIEINSNNPIKSYLLEKNGTLIGSINNNELYLLTNTQKFLQRKTWLLPKRTEQNYTMQWSFNEKKLTKQNYWPPQSFQTSNWIPGINLITFKMCNGAYPTQETLKKSLVELSKTPHSDWMINNMVLQGDKLAWIDIDDLSRGNYSLLKPTNFSEEGLQAHQELITLQDPKMIDHYFWYQLIRVPILKKCQVRFFSQFITPSSKVFDIHTESEDLLNIYLGYGTKVVAFEPDQKISKNLAAQFESEDVSILNNQTLEEFTGKFGLDAMISLYGKPKFCNLHSPVNTANTILKGLSQPIEYIAFKFDLQSKEALIDSLKHLSSLGYRQYNFSPRNLPVLGLDSNSHIGKKEKWVNSGEIVNEIEKFASLDPAGTLWGYVYARYPLETCN